MNPKETTKYVTLRAAALMFLVAEGYYDEASRGYRDGGTSISEVIALGTRLDAARSVLWDVINDKEIKEEQADLWTEALAGYSYYGDSRVEDNTGKFIIIRKPKT